MATKRLSNKTRYWSGKAKETVGKLSGNRRTQYEGRLDQARATLKDAREQVKGAFTRPPRR